MPRFIPLSVSLLAVLTLTGCGQKAAEPAATTGPVKIKFQTDWFPQPEHGGYYQALAKGYYAAEGLDVEILPGGPNAQVKEQVAMGKAQLGMTNGDDVIVAAARGLPIKIVAAEMQRDPQGILFHEENPLRSLQDLQGRTLMAGSVSTWLEVVRKKLGVQFNQMPLVGDLARFMNDKTLLRQCFVTNEPFFARQRGANVGALLIASDTYEPYRVMFASNDYLAKHPEVVAKFVRASIRGWVDYLTGDPAPANALIAAKNDIMSPEFMAYSIKAMNDYKLVAGDPAKGEYAGQITTVRLQKQIALLQEVGVLDKPVKPEDVAAMEFVPKQ
ncbi:NMT1/THI5 like protein [Lacunisphaera limnophila]|uniref:Thiamine pyrimidine synthase n=1 Tax=Lacunisphaera limnophila TaxID=1838286 RepID=A0A1D8AY42_9BACT|nr:ABC transporter substrate-binding protein [Lacunisphaera limnophila]AOS45784.1 NMT1/THI5 like protein [Lacunisphaera limnophila]